jgi:ABC-type cobalamin transport system permease subunit
LLAVLASAWLLIANRAPNLEQYAAVRNAIAGVFALIVAVIPVIKFARSPRAVVLSGMIAWAILCACYFVWTFYFDDLDRVNTLRFFMMGTVVYGLAAALAWLGRALLAAREKHDRQLDHSHHPAHTLNHS